jgi:hypothetical protein
MGKNIIFSKEIEKAEEVNPDQANSNDKAATAEQQGKSSPEQPGDQGPEDRQLTKSEARAVKSLEKRIAEHEDKVAEFESIPTVRPGMEGQPESVIQAAQERRVLHLKREIEAFRGAIKKIRDGE